MNNKLTLDILKAHAIDLSESAIFQILVILIFLDIVTGTSKAITNKSLNSKISSSGLVKHAVILVLSTVIGIYARTLGVVAISQAFVLGFIASYGMSLLENLEAMGIPMPKGLREMFEQMREREFKISNADLIIDTKDKNTAEVIDNLENSEEITEKTK